MALSGSFRADGISVWLGVAAEIVLFVGSIGWKEELLDIGVGNVWKSVVVMLAFVAAIDESTCGGITDAL